MSIQADNLTPAPVVLCFSGHDPSGGAGIQADIEAIAAQGVHAATIITALTLQDTSNVLSFSTVDATQLKRQAELILADMPVKAIKIGMTASVEIVQAIHDIISAHPDIPVILDPVLAAGGGTALAGEQLVAALNELIIPHCTLVTPNIPEALQLTELKQMPDLALTEQLRESFLRHGTEAMLVTGSHADSDDITHLLLQQNNRHLKFTHARLDGEFHGSGCTLASAIAAQLALGVTLEKAVENGLGYTLKTLAAARPLGRGQLIPQRLTSTASPLPLFRSLLDGSSAASAKTSRLNGLYAITDELLIGLYLEHAVEQALQGGARIIQYRNKTTNQKRRLEQASLLRRLCNQYHSLLIINDDVDLALAVDADGVHIGRDDQELKLARQKLGPDKIIGVSCYNDLALAIEAEQHGADYVAFGAFYSSSIKPDATPAGVELLQQARRRLTIPVCGIGGITADNASPLIAAGADMLAVISDLFEKSPENAGIKTAAEQISQLFSA